MPFAKFLRRGACAALALVVLVSSLTCMTVACRVLCNAATGTTDVATAAADLPPCHRPAGSAGETGTNPGGCGAGMVCCSTWLHDGTSIDLAAPRLVREFVPDAGPALAPLPLAQGDPDVPFSIDVGRAEVRAALSPHLASSASRAPPRILPAA